VRRKGGRVGKKKEFSNKTEKKKKRKKRIKKKMKDFKNTREHRKTGERERHTTIATKHTKRTIISCQSPKYV
jgi:hypothetical protein